MLDCDAGYLHCPLSKVKESGIHPLGEGLPLLPHLKLLNSVGCVR